MNSKQKTYSGNTLFSILLLLVFTVFTLMIAGTGAAVYKNSTSHLNENYTSRTAIAYISEKIRQHNSMDDIFLSNVEGTDALALRETIDGETYLTYIYHYDGALCELLVKEDTRPMLLSGSPIVELVSIEFSAVSPSDILEKNLPEASAAKETSAAHQGSFLSITAVSPEGHSLSMLVHYCGIL